MALRLRRGTESERQNLVTPLSEGELIYVTDTGKLFIGNGTATGGVEVIGSGGGGGATTLDALTDTELTGFTDGDVLTYIAASNKWEPIPVPGASAIGINDLTDVDITPSALDMLIYDGYNFVTVPVQTIFQEQQNWRVNIVGDDSTILVDTDTNSFRGTLFGTVEGDIKGSIFGDDSTLLVDAVSNKISANSVLSSIVDTGLIYGSPPEREDGLRIFIPNGSSLNVVSHNGAPEEPTATSPGDFISSISLLGTTDTSTSKVAGAIISQWDATADLNTDYPRGNIFFAVGQNSNDPNLVAELDYTGNFTSKSISPGTYADAAARDAAIASPVAGMMVFLTDGDGAGNPKFQGNTDGTITGWVNLN